MNHYRVTLTRNGLGKLKARRKPLLFLFRRWQLIAIGQAEDLQQMCTRLNKLMDGAPLIPASAVPHAPFKLSDH